MTKDELIVQAEDTLQVITAMKRERISTYFNAADIEKLRKLPLSANQVTTRIYAVQADVVDVVILSAEKGKVGVLNFASAKNPGGGFLKGAQSQEEALSRASDLYLYLKKEPRFYRNPLHHQTTIYDSDMIYAKNVCFFKDSLGKEVHPIVADVISSCAVNTKHLNKQTALASLVQREMYKRMEGVIELAARERIDILILGAFGCGVFGNDPHMVRQLWVDILHLPRYKGIFKEIIFAVHDVETFTIFQFPEFK